MASLDRIRAMLLNPSRGGTVNPMTGLPVAPRVMPMIPPKVAGLFNPSQGGTVNPMTGLPVAPAAPIGPAAPMGGGPMPPAEVPPINAAGGIGRDPLAGTAKRPSGFLGMLSPAMTGVRPPMLGQQRDRPRNLWR